MLILIANVLSDKESTTHSGWCKLTSHMYGADQVEIPSSSSPESVMCGVLPTKHLQTALDNHSHLLALFLGLAFLCWPVSGAASCCSSTNARNKQPS